MKKYRYNADILFACTLLILCAGPACIFNPDPGTIETPPGGTWEEPRTPDKVLKNLRSALNQRDIEMYERCLDEDFFYRSPSAVDSLDIIWSRSVERAVMENMMNQVKEIVFTASENSRFSEYGRNVPNIPPGERIDEDNEHPDQVWIIIDAYVTIDVFTNQFGDFKAQQDMQFKMVEDPRTGLYTIIQWYDENPLTE